ncbi:MAG: tRNA (N(6)-L-threonylcarbamoyladenosine(37)-C(2))-methylthiotransferase MtaB [Dehalococcoidia bacterium]|nr:MAG: tRNA (N(6)-L-threonylcarbamoyladenosine(37)-C(2))-methylthiotransferase MtaB [Dehalococcoidia bacterium]
MITVNKGGKVKIDTLGCKLNQAETEVLTELFVNSGYGLAESVNEADIYVLNTCTVTHIADRKTRRLLRAAKRCNGNTIVVAIGCYVERNNGELAAIDGVDMVVGNDEKMNILPLMELKGYLTGKDGSWQNSLSKNVIGIKNRTFIKAQDGCNNLCAYCIVPLVRGREKSVPVGEIITRIKDKVVDGYKEVVLTGTEIGSYHHNGITLSGLVKKILDETSIERLRLSSLQPQHITQRLVEIWHNRRLCSHLHLPLQSGSDGVLKRMERRYSTKEYDTAVSLVRATVPNVAITTDIMVGFPGESANEFEESINFCREMDFARIHVFPFSSRYGTKATEMKGQLDAGMKKQRSQSMITLAEESARKFRERFLGSTGHVLWEKKHEGIWSGLTANYIRVYARNVNDLANEITRVKLEKQYKDGIWGR